MLLTSMALISLLFWKLNANVILSFGILSFFIVLLFYCIISFFILFLFDVEQFSLWGGGPSASHLQTGKPNLFILPLFTSLPSLPPSSLLFSFLTSSQHLFILLLDIFNHFFRLRGGKRCERERKGKTLCGYHRTQSAARIVKVRAVREDRRERRREEGKRGGIIERGEREEREEERERRSFDSYICIVHIEKNDGCMHMVCQLSAF